MILNGVPLKGILLSGQYLDSSRIDGISMQCPFLSKKKQEPHGNNGSSLKIDCSVLIFLMNGKEFKVKILFCQGLN